MVPRLRGTCWWPLPEGLDLKDAALVEPSAVAWHSCHLGRVGTDTRVAVVGAGAIGILAAASAQTMGSPEVAVEARHPHQHEAWARISATTPNGDYDVVIETAGSESGLHRAVELARPGGTVVYVGVYGDISWPHAQAFAKEVALRPSLGYCAHHGRREFAEAADMLAARAGAAGDADHPPIPARGRGGGVPRGPGPVPGCVPGRGRAIGDRGPAR